jgi:hypothetical protein
MKLFIKLTPHSQPLLHKELAERSDSWLRTASVNPRIARLQICYTWP